MKRLEKIFLLTVLLLTSLTAAARAQRELGVRPTESGGPLKFEQAVFDVQSYDITLRVDPKAKAISGATVMRARIVIPTNVILLDLDTPFTVSTVKDSDGKDLRFQRTETAIRIFFPLTKQPGEEIETVIAYSGIPRIAPRPPWVGGFMWEKTQGGADWVSVALQNDGADLLFPCKDHPSDKPAAVAMHITVPDPLVAVGPGRSEGSQTNSDGTTTYNWRMTNPISNYSIVFNAAPYKLVNDKYRSIAGDDIPIAFYVLPEDADKAQRLIEETKKYIKFYEHYLGPYPFRSQKLGIVETPHLGMEHSTAIAYGNKFRFDADGTDSLMLHEFGHEWWANLVTAADWKDFWIHEGFQSYMDTLYQEYLHGRDAYNKAMAARAKNFRNMQPVAPREAKIAYQVYMAEPDYLRSDGDIYGKGAYILHTLRYLIGDDAFFRALRRMAYPTRDLEKATDGRQVRLVTTDDFLTIAEEESGRRLDWFFELYLRQPKLPKLISEISGNQLLLRWETPNNMPFPMPINIINNGKTERIEMKDGQTVITFNGTPPVIDPDALVLKSK
jgi:aminopeptidase N